MNRRQRKKLIASNNYCSHQKKHLFTITCFKRCFWMNMERCVDCKSYSVNKQAERKRRAYSKTFDRRTQNFLNKWVRLYELAIKNGEYGEFK